MPQGGEMDESKTTQKELPDALHSAIAKPASMKPWKWMRIRPVHSKWIGCGRITCASFQLRFCIRYFDCSTAVLESQCKFIHPYQTGHHLFISFWYNNHVVTDKCAARRKQGMLHAQDQRFHGTQNRRLWPGSDYLPGAIRAPSACGATNNSAPGVSFWANR